MLFLDAAAPPAADATTSKSGPAAGSESKELSVGSGDLSRCTGTKPDVEPVTSPNIISEQSSAMLAKKQISSLSGDGAVKRTQSASSGTVKQTQVASIGLVKPIEAACGGLVKQIETTSGGGTVKTVDDAAADDVPLFRVNLEHGKQFNDQLICMFNNS